MNFINNPYGKKSENNPKLKSLNNLNYDFENFLESNLKLSEIENNENDTIKFESISSINNLDLLKTNNKIENGRINLKRNKKRLTIEDLDNIPLPIFSCIYCSNEKISFNHLINTNLSNKYFLQTSIYDMKILNKIIKTKYNVDNWEKNFPLKDIIIRNTEFMSRYYNKSELNGIYKTQIMKKIYKQNNIKNYKSIIQKLKVKLIRKRNREFNLAKSNSNKIFLSNDYKPSFQKKNNNNSTFINDNLNTNKNSLTNTNCVSSSPNRALSMSSNININDNTNANNNNLNIVFNQKNMMKSIMEKIEKNEESEFESEEKFIDILDNQINLKQKINKNKIKFEDKYYDIWNPEITLINDEDNDGQNRKNKNYLSEKNNKIKKILNIIHKKKKLYNINNNKNKDYYQNKKNDKYININNNYENEINKEIKDNNDIVIPLLNNNIKKRNLISFFNNNKIRKSSIESLSVKGQFYHRNYNFKKINSHDNIHIMFTKNKEKYNNLFSSQNGYKKLLNILKPKTNNYKHIIINRRNPNKLVLQSSLSLFNYPSNKTKSNLTSFNFHDNKNNSLKNKNITIKKNINLRSNNNISHRVDLNNKEINKIQNYIKIPFNPKFNSSRDIQSRRELKPSFDKDSDDFASLPNLNLKISPINKFIENKRIINSYHNKQSINETSLRKINSHKILERKYISLSRPSTRKIINEKNYL